MKVKKIATIVGGQDGTIYQNFLFRFNHKGDATVYQIDALRGLENKDEPAPVFARFHLDGTDWMNPHSNAVFFGNERVDPADEFPVLYSNIYNNYEKCEKYEDRRQGTLVAYRITREGNVFSSKLIQIIKVGFADDDHYWRSAIEFKDFRPYGNFVFDAEKNHLYAYTMRDLTYRTRYFKFDMPAWNAGEPEPDHEDVRRVVLWEKDMLDFFDVEYHRYVQGGCVHHGKVYEVEGFSGKNLNAPALRIIDLEKKRQEFFILFEVLGLTSEAEWIDFDGEDCLYSDGKGNLISLDFQL